MGFRVVELQLACGPVIKVPVCPKADRGQELLVLPYSYRLLRKRNAIRWLLGHSPCLLFLRGCASKGEMSGVRDELGHRRGVEILGLLRAKVVCLLVR